MSFDEIVSSIANMIGQSVADKIGVQFRAEAHRGMCAGSVRYRFKPKKQVDEYQVMACIQTMYEMMNGEIDLHTPEGCNLFVRTFLTACKELVRGGSRVNLAGLLVYEAQAYSDGSDAWLKPIAINREFNRLSTNITLDKPLDKIKKAQRAARRNPFDNVIGGEKVAQATFIRCEACGHVNKIAET